MKVSRSNTADTTRHFLVFRLQDRFLGLQADDQDAAAVFRFDRAAAALCGKAGAHWRFIVRLDSSTGSPQ
jgi:hypothetical protein